MYILYILTISVVLCSDVAEILIGADVETFTLDISEDTSRKEYTVERDTEHVVSYICNPGYLFNSITLRGDVIWKGDDLGTKAENYAPTMRKMRLAILHESGKFTLYQKYRELVPWVDITNEQLDMTRISFHGWDGELITNTIPDLDEMSYGFILKRDEHCQKVFFNRRMLWNCSTHRKIGHIESVWVDLVRSTMYMKIRKRAGRYRLMPDAGIKFFEGDKEYAKGTYRITREGEKTVFSVRGKCTMVTYDDEVVWRHQEGPKPHVVILWNNTQIIDVRFQEFYLECKREDEWKHERKEYLHPFFVPI